MGHTKLIASLTSFGENLKLLSKTIPTLIRQKIKFDKICIVIEEKDKNNLPNDLKEIIKQNKQIEIIWTKKNLKSFLKLIPTYEKYSDSYICTFDDDTFYRKDWTSKVVKEINKNPNCIICGRTVPAVFKHKKVFKDIYFSKKISYNNMFMGCNGVCYPPHCFDAVKFDEKDIIENYKYNDDIYFWKLSLLNKIKTLNINFKYSGRRIKKASELAISSCKGGHGDINSMFYDTYVLQKTLRNDKISSLLPEYKSINFQWYYRRDKKRGDIIPLNDEVTFAIALYNSSKTILSTLESVKNLDYDHKKIHLLFCDNNSSDDSIELATNFCKKNKFNYQLIKEKRQGIQFVRKALIGYIKTPFFLFLDSDDWYTKDSLHLLFSKMTVGVDMVCGKVNKKLGENLCLRYRTPFTKKVWFYSTLWAVLYRTSFVKTCTVHYSPLNSMSFNEENLITLELMKNKPNVQYVNGLVYLLNRSIQTSTWKVKYKNTKKIEELLQITTYTLNFIKKYNLVNPKKYKPFAFRGFYKTLRNTEVKKSIKKEYLNKLKQLFN